MATEDNVSLNKTLEIEKAIVFSKEWEEFTQFNNIVSNTKCTTHLYGAELSKPYPFYSFFDNSREILICKSCKIECQKDNQYVKNQTEEDEIEKEGFCKCECELNDHEQIEISKEKGSCDDHKEFVDNNQYFSVTVNNHDEKCQCGIAKLNQKTARICLFCMVDLLGRAMDQDHPLNMIKVETLSQHLKYVCKCKLKHHKADFYLYLKALVYLNQYSTILEMKTVNMKFDSVVKSVWDSKKFKKIIEGILKKNDDILVLKTLGEFSAILNNKRLTPYLHFDPIELSNIISATTLTALFKDLENQHSDLSYVKRKIHLSTFFYLKFFPFIRQLKNTFVGKDMSFSAIHRKVFLRDISVLYEFMDGRESFFALLDQLNNFILTKLQEQNLREDSLLQSTLFVVIYYFLRFLQSFKYFNLTADEAPSLNKMGYYIKTCYSSYNSLIRKNILIYIDQSGEGKSKFDVFKYLNCNNSEKVNAINMAIKKKVKFDLDKCMKVVSKYLFKKNNSIGSEKVRSDYFQLNGEWIVNMLESVVRDIFLKFNDLALLTMDSIPDEDETNSFCFQLKNKCTNEFLPVIFSDDNKYEKIESIEIIDLLLHQNDCYIKSYENVVRSSFCEIYSTQSVLSHKSVETSKERPFKESLKKFIMDASIVPLKEELEEIKKEVKKISDIKGPEKYRRQIELFQLGLFNNLLEILNMVGKYEIDNSIIKLIMTCIKLLVDNNPFLVLCLFAKKNLKVLFYKEYKNKDLLFYFSLSLCYSCLRFLNKYDYRFSFTTFTLILYDYLESTKKTNKPESSNKDFIIKMKINTMLNMVLKRILNVNFTYDFSNVQILVIKIIFSHYKQANYCKMIEDVFKLEKIPLILSSDFEKDDNQAVIMEEANNTLDSIHYETFDSFENELKIETSKISKHKSSVSEIMPFEDKVNYNSGRELLTINKPLKPYKEQSELDTPKTDNGITARSEKLLQDLYKNNPNLLHFTNYLISFFRIVSVLNLEENQERDTKTGHLKHESQDNRFGAEEFNPIVENIGTTEYKNNLIDSEKDILDMKRNNTGSRNNDHNIQEINSNLGDEIIILQEVITTRIISPKLKRVFAVFYFKYNAKNITRKNGSGNDNIIIQSAEDNEAQLKEVEETTIFLIQSSFLDFHHFKQSFTNKFHLYVNYFHEVCFTPTLFCIYRSSLIIQNQTNIDKYSSYCMILSYLIAYKLFIDNCISSNIQFDPTDQTLKLEKIFKVIDDNSYLNFTQLINKEGSDKLKEEILKMKHNFSNPLDFQHTTQIFEKYYKLIEVEASAQSDILKDEFTIKIEDYNRLKDSYSELAVCNPRLNKVISNTIKIEALRTCERALSKEGMYDIDKYIYFLFKTQNKLIDLDKELLQNINIKNMIESSKNSDEENYNSGLFQYINNLFYNKILIDFFSLSGSNRSLEYNIANSIIQFYSFLCMNSNTYAQVYLARIKFSNYKIPEYFFKIAHEIFQYVAYLDTKDYLTQLLKEKIHYFDLLYNTIINFQINLVSGSHPYIYLNCFQFSSYEKWYDYNMDMIDLLDQRMGCKYYFYCFLKFCTAMLRDYCLITQEDFNKHVNEESRNRVVVDNILKSIKPSILLEVIVMMGKELESKKNIFKDIHNYRNQLPILDDFTYKIIEEVFYLLYILNSLDSYNLEIKELLNEKPELKEYYDYFQQVFNNIEIVVNFEDKLDPTFFKGVPPESKVSECFNRIKENERKKSGQIVKTVFRIHPYCLFLYYQDFDSLYKEIDLSDHNERHRSLIELINKIKDTTEKRVMLTDPQRSSKFISKLINFNYQNDYYIKKSAMYFTIILSIIINLLLIIDNQSFSDFDSGRESTLLTVIYFINIVHFGILFVFTLNWMIVYLIYDLQGDRKYFFNRKYTIYSNFLISLLNLASSIFRFLYSFQLFSITGVFSTMKMVFKAIESKYSNFLNTGVFIIISVWIFSGVGFYFLDKNFIVSDIKLCQTYFHCFISIFNYGLRDGTVDNNLKSKSDDNYYSRMVFEWLFFVIINLILLNMINGIIVDTFQTYRMRDDINKEQNKNYCYICSLNNVKFNIYGLNFEDHKKRIHPPSYYVNYLITISSMKDENLSFIQYYVKQLFDTNSTVFLPNNTCYQLKDYNFD